MNTFKKHPGTILLLAIIMLFLFDVSIYGYAFGNGAGNVYEPQASYSQETLSIGAYIIQGASSFFETEVNIKGIMQMVELQNSPEFDYIVLNDLLNRAISNLDRALTVYDSLISLANVTPYNNSVIDSLKTFDYDSFKDQLGLNATIYDMVKEFLRKGNVTGMFCYIRTQFSILKENLLQIKASTSVQILPELEEFWTLNESCSSLSTFGSYGARIFYAIN